MQLSFISSPVSSKLHCCSSHLGSGYTVAFHALAGDPLLPLCSQLLFSATSPHTCVLTLPPSRGGVLPAIALCPGSTLSVHLVIFSDIPGLSPAADG